jgi:hypothetical protein
MQQMRRVREEEVRERAWAGEGERTQLPFIEGERERRGHRGGEGLRRLHNSIDGGGYRRGE